ncbi:MAG: hypothetical protein FGM58_00725 [Acidimicrobiia bacterium]|nr:hypothetical protein [Acidimicrobiia bacterium]
MAANVGRRARWWAQRSVSGTGGLDWIGSVAIAATLGVAALTIVGTSLGPSADAETNDRLTLLAWWTLAAALVVMVVRVTAARTSSSPSMSPLRTAAAVLGLGVLVLAVTWTVDPTGLWPGIATSDLVLGALVAVALVAAWSRRSGVGRLSPILMTAVVLAFVIPALIQTPATIRDPYHFAFTGDEMASVAAGDFPLSTYIPQYANLLGFIPALPIAILGNSMWLVVLFLVGLQVIAFTCVIFLPLSVLPRRSFALVTAVAVIPSVAVGTGSGSATTYFAAVPLRVVLPVVAILATYRFVSSRGQGRLPDHWAIIGLGLLLGVTALNNPDFGLPAAAVCTMVLLATGPWELVVRRTLTLGCAALAVFVGYTLLGALTGNSVDWSYWLAFQTKFGSDGTMAEPMASFGLHVAFAALFVTTLAVGVGLMVRRRAASVLGRTGLMMTLAGGWSLLALAYFTGRSLTPTLVAGYAFLVGMCVATMLPLMAVGYRTLRSSARAKGRDATWIAIAFGAVALVGTLSFFGRVPAPSKMLEPLTKQQDLGRFTPLGAMLDGLDNVLALPANADVRAAVASGEAAQILPTPSFVDLVAGIRTVSPASSPIYVDLDPLFTELACDRRAAAAPKFFIVEATVSLVLESNPRCASLLDFRAARLSVQGDYRFSIIPVRPVTG